MYTNILFATDLLNEHRHLIEKALAVAKKFNSTLFLIHVIEMPMSFQIAQGLGFTELAVPAKEDAETVLSLIGDNFNITKTQQIVEVGSVKEHVINKAQELNCDLIIIGSHSSSEFRALLGSTAQAIVNHATCDVLTLKIQQ